MWSPDGRAIAFASGRTGAQNIWLKTVDGPISPRRLTEARIAQNPVDWSEAIDRLAFYTVFPGRDRDIWTATPDGATERLLSTSFDERSPADSPH